MRAGCRRTNGGIVVVPDHVTSAHVLRNRRGVGMNSRVGLSSSSVANMYCTSDHDSREMIDLYVSPLSSLGLVESSSTPSSILRGIGVNCVEGTDAAGGSRQRRANAEEVWSFRKPSQDKSRPWGKVELRDAMMS